MSFGIVCGDAGVHGVGTVACVAVFVSLGGWCRGSVLEVEFSVLLCVCGLIVVRFGVVCVMSLLGWLLLVLVLVLLLLDGDVCCDFVRRAWFPVLACWPCYLVFRADECC